MSAIDRLDRSLEVVSERIEDHRQLLNNFQASLEIATDRGVIIQLIAKAEVARLRLECEERVFAVYQDAIAKIREAK